jgi:Ala-tRNA(Pro) deacylase
MPRDAYDDLLAFLDDHGASYRVIEHDPQGQTEIVSRLRGHDPAAAAKCMVVMVKISKKQKIYVLAVVPGDQRVDLAAIKAMYGGTYAGIADASTAEQLTGCAVGTILPFTRNERLNLVVDPALFDHDEIYFNAGRLDRSLALDRDDYRRLITDGATLLHCPG